MSKHVEGVESYFDHIFTHKFLNIQPIFNPKKSFGKLRLRPFQPYHPILCMSKHVEGVESYFDFQPYHPILCMSKHVEGVKSRNNFQPLQHALTYIVLDGMVGKV